MAYSIQTQLDSRPPVVEAIFKQYKGENTAESTRIMHALNELEFHYIRHTTEILIAMRKEYNELLEKQHKETVARYNKLLEK